MKKNILIILLVIVSILKSQGYYSTKSLKHTSLDVITNPASIAMGESFVANYYNSSSFIENPANLISKNNTSLFYNTRLNNWTSIAENYKYTTVGGSMRMPFAVLGIAYSEFKSGKVYFPYDESNQFTEERNSTLSFSLSKNIYDNLSIGITTKFFNHDKTGSLGKDYELESKTAMLFDVGALYNVFQKSELNYEHRLTIGTTLENFGTDYKEYDHYLYNDFQKVRIPRYLKLGFAYNLQFKNSLHGSDLDLTLTGQYKSHINPLEDENGDTDYWGAGSQIIIKEIFIARVGVIQLPDYDLLYDRAKTTLRYGIGINLSMQKLGANLPFTIIAEYSFMPINKISLLDNNGNVLESKKVLSSFGITLRMNDFMFDN